MRVVEINPVPIYEVACPECKSKLEYTKIEYTKADVYLYHIQCPVCGVSMWPDTICSKRMEEPK